MVECLSSRIILSSSFEIYLFCICHSGSFPIVLLEGKLVQSVYTYDWKGMVVKSVRIFSAACSLSILLQH